MQRIVIAALIVGAAVLGGAIGYGLQALSGQRVGALGDTADRGPTIDRYHRTVQEDGEVHAVHAQNQSVVLRSWGLRTSRPLPDNVDPSNVTLDVWLTATGGDVEAVGTPEGCDEPACRLRLATEGDGAQVTASRHAPAATWDWRVTALDTTVRPISFSLRLDWISIREV